jgi:hypothetical protein
VSSLVWSETFAYAEGWDEQRQRYLGLKAGTSIRVIVDDRSLLVIPEAAATQIDADHQAATSGTAAADPTSQPAATAGNDNAATTTGQPTSTDTTPQSVKLTRFHASVRLDPVRLGRDAARIAEEVVQHLTGLVGAEVEITLEIQANLPDGASDKLVRDVTENCRTFRFSDHGFEENWYASSLPIQSFMGIIAKRLANCRNLRPALRRWLPLLFSVRRDPNNMQ